MMANVLLRWLRPLAIVLAIAAVATSLSKPVAFDETNFLRLAAGAAADPWRPHNIAINWQGTTETAFAVLSNPPGIAWWLGPVLNAPVWQQRAWMLPWSFLAIFGARWLAAKFSPGSAVLLLASPIVALSATALLPDMPLYACILAGVGGYVRAVDAGKPAWPWALLAGCAVLFRDSGVAIFPLLPLYAYLNRKSMLPALAGLLPLGLLVLHDLHAYGAIHLLEMGTFQSVSNTPGDIFHKAVAAICTLGGAAALPVFRWRGASLLGAITGGVAGIPFGVLGVGFGALGGATVGSLAQKSERPAPDAAFLLTWGVGGLVFLLSLRFTAARYWLPFVVPFLLVAPAISVRIRTVVTCLLTVALVVEDGAHARAETAFAEQVAALGRGSFTGHWGWQSVLEREGWTPLDEGSSVRSGTLVAIPRESWPQTVQVRCDQVVFEGQSASWVPWLPRGYTTEGPANLHSNWMAGVPPVRTVAPWWFGSDPYEWARVCAE